MSRALVLALEIVFALVLVAEPAGATLSARVTFYRVDNVCNVADEYDGWPLNGAPDLGYYAAIARADRTVLVDHSVCDADGPDDRCGTWDFADHSLSATIGDGTTVCLYFGLFDVDTADADDSVGNHWVCPSTSMLGSAGVWNNDLVSPDLTPACGDTVEGSAVGLSTNWYLSYRFWYEDNTAPSAVTPDTADDALSNPAWDNDTRLDLTWLAAADVESGISAYAFTLVDQTSATTVFDTVSAPATRTLTLCPSGCDRTFTPIHGHSHAASIRATNGDYPAVLPTRSTWGSARAIAVDLVNPTTSFTSPAAGSWHNANVAVAVDDSDDGAGIDTAGCRWQVVSNGVTTRSLTARTCNESLTLTVGTAMYCRHQGANMCLVSANSTDLARRGSATASRSFSIDWSADALSSLNAYTADGGALISPAGWTTDRDPFFNFRVDTGARVSPIAGYSHAIDADPDCVELEVAGGDTGSVALPANALAAGVHTFRVRALDVAGNCGPVASLTVQVDDAADAVDGLGALTEAGGEAIALATWQTDNDPYLSWSVPASVSPVVGYSIAWDAVPDCTVDTASAWYQTPDDALSDGVHVFGVRAIDAAGNCGVVTTATLQVLATPLVLAVQSAPAGPVRAGTTLTLTVTASHELAGLPRVSVAGGGDATHTGTDGSTYSFTYTVAGTEVSTLDPGGAPVTISVAGENLAGVSGAAETAIVFDFNPPPLAAELVVTPPVATTASALRLELEAAEPLAGLPQVTIVAGGGRPAVLGSQDDLAFVYDYAVVGDEGEGTVGVEVSLEDLAGNTAVHQGSFALDLTAPTVQITYPTQGAVLDLGATVALTWDTVDEHRDRVTIEQSIDGGLSFAVTLAADISDVGSYPWLVDGPQSTHVRLRVTATDAVGLVGSAESLFDFRVREAVADHVIASADDGVAVIHGNERVSLIVVDALGAPVAGEHALSLSVGGAAIVVDTDLQGAAVGGSSLSGLTRADGTAFVSVTDATAELVEVVPEAAGMGQVQSHVSAWIEFLPVDAAQSTVEAVPAVVLADGEAFSRITVTPRDEAGDLIGAGLDVQVSADFGTLEEVIDVEDGTYTTRLRSESCRPEPAIVAASILDLGVSDTASVTFTCLRVAAAILQAEPTTIVADGTTCATLTLYLFDAAGAALPPGQAVAMIASYGTLSAVEEVQAGEYRALLCSRSCATEPIVVTVTVNGVSLSTLTPPPVALVAVECLTVDPAASTLTAQPAVLPADALSAATITVTPVRTDAQRFGAGLEVVIAASCGELTATADQGDGTYTALLTSGEPCTSAVSATAGGVALEATATVEFRAADARRGQPDTGCACGSGASFSGFGLVTALVLMAVSRRRRRSSASASANPPGSG